MYEKLTLAFSASAFVMSAGTLGVIWWGLRSAAKALRSPEPRVTKGELAFDHAKPEVAVKLPDGQTRYISSAGMLASPESFDSPVIGGPPVGNVIPLFGPIGGE